MSNKLLIGGICCLTLLFTSGSSMTAEDYKYETIYNESVEIESVVPAEDVIDGKIWCVKENSDGTRISETPIKGVVDGEDVIINLWLKESFKGNVYFITKDEKGEETVLEKAEGIILELPQTHELEDNIKIDLQDCEYMNEIGDYIYSGPIDAEVIIEDSYSGIEWFEICLEKKDGSFEAEEIYVKYQEPGSGEELGNPEEPVNESGAKEEASWHPVDESGAKEETFGHPVDESGMEDGTSDKTEDENNGDEEPSKEPETDRETGCTILRTDRNIVTKLSKKLKIEENDDSLCLRISMRDNAGNESTRRVIFNVDSVKPQIDFKFNDEPSENGYYAANKNATITITERAINREEVKAEIEDCLGEGVILSEWKEIPSDDIDKKKYTIEAYYGNDGAYSVDLQIKDLAGNLSNVIHEDRFIIDKTPPVVNVFFDKEKTSKGEFYNTVRKAYIAIDEVNFDPELLVINGVNYGDAKANFPQISMWERDENISVGVIEFKDSGIYEFSVDLSDPAGNKAEKVILRRFGIDTKAPTIVMDGIVNDRSYNDDVECKMSISDEFIDGSSISLKIYKDNQEINAKEVFEVSENGMNMLLKNVEKIRENDGHYKIVVSAEDMAGNKMDRTLEFVLNRFGSTFSLGKEAKKINGGYTTRVQGINVYETNIDNVDSDSVEIKLLFNSVPKLLEEGKDYEVVKSVEGNKNKYNYKLKDDLFINDGLYEIRFTSLDESGNENDINNENQIKFIKDDTCPVITPVNLESDKYYQSNKMDMSVRIQDNLNIEDAVILVNDSQVEYVKENDRYYFTMNKSKDYQTVEIVAKDSAGNETKAKFDQILITGSALVKLWHNKPALYMVIGAGVAVLIINMFLLYYCKQKSKNKG